MSAALAHEIIGHMGEARTRATAKHMGFELTRWSFQTCELCATGKSKQKNVPQISDHNPATKRNERIFLDISTIKEPKGDKEVAITRMNWLIMVDEYSGMKISSFHDTKNGMLEPTCDMFENWRQNGRPMKFIRCDNGGENVKLESRANIKDWKLNLEFEYTGRDTPQQNHMTEVEFSTLGGRV